MKKTIKVVGIIAIVSVMVFMVGCLYSANKELSELKSEYSDLRSDYSALNGKYQETSRCYSKLSDEYEELNDEYEELVKGVHNKLNGKSYDFSYNLDGVTYGYEGNNKLFGNYRWTIK